MPNRSPHRNPKSLGNAQLSYAFRPQIRPLDSTKTLFFSSLRGRPISLRCPELVGQSTGIPGSRERHSGPPEWWQFEGKRATAMTIETKVSEHALTQWGTMV